MSKKSLHFVFALAVIVVFAGMAMAHDSDSCRTHNNKCVPKIGSIVPFNNFESSSIEGIAISPQNDIYVATREGQIYKVRPDGTFSFFSKLTENPGDGYVLGLVVAKDGTLFASVSGCNAPGIGGVWHIDKDGNTELAMQVQDGPACTSVPNNLTFDDKGNLYVTDSTYGSVWRLGYDGCIGRWLQDPLLMPVHNMGGNGIAYRNHSLWIVNSDTASIIQVPIQADGSAGKPTVFLHAALLGSPDLAVFDDCGNLWVADRNGSLVRVSPAGVPEIMITAAQFKGFHSPTNPVFGFGKLRTTLFISGAGPNVVKVEVGVAGMMPPQFAGETDKDKDGKHHQSDRDCDDE